MARRDSSGAVQYAQENGAHRSFYLRRGTKLHSINQRSCLMLSLDSHSSRSQLLSQRECIARRWAIAGAVEQLCDRCPGRGVAMMGNGCVAVVEGRVGIVEIE